MPVVLPQAQHILDAAMTLAEQTSWEAVRLHDVAGAAGVELGAIREHFREKDALIDAWFDRADAAMLALSDAGELSGMNPRQRVSRLVMAWLEALAMHRRVTRQMILSKCEPGHLHIQIPALMRVSRTVQWLREAAGLRDAGVRRAIAETLLTAIYLATFVHWLRDPTADPAATHDLLDCLLDAVPTAFLAEAAVECGS